MTKQRFFVSVMAMLLFANPSLALQEPHPLAMDKRIQTVRYSPNEVYEFIGHYGYQAFIEFAPDEEVSTVSIGDSVAWQVNPVGSRLFLKPVEQDALTNMSVITNKRTYHFELHAEETENIRAANMVFVLRFIYPDDYAGDYSNFINEDPVPDLTDPEVMKTLNFNYSLVGSDVISPIRIFDDGEFTYFEFKDVNADIPAFFVVDSGGEENLLNFRKNASYIVVERVSSQFTLRHGSDVLCVFNESKPLPPRAIPSDDKQWWEIF
ncbi:MAG: P-type conjugative transfer protein VirB9 [Rickettsiales bacterium]|nr:P-type conjugative transfer protein VirB9 [Rickettsiales bacterium]